jgi:hypothetical protein
VFERRWIKNERRERVSAPDAGFLDNPGDRDGHVGEIHIS